MKFWQCRSSNHHTQFCTIHIRSNLHLEDSSTNTPLELKPTTVCCLRQGLFQLRPHSNCCRLSILLQLSQLLVRLQLLLPLAGQEELDTHHYNQVCCRYPNPWDQYTRRLRFFVLISFSLYYLRNSGAANMLQNPEDISQPATYCSVKLRWRQLNCLVSFQTMSVCSGDKNQIQT